MKNVVIAFIVCACVVSGCDKAAPDAEVSAEERTALLIAAITNATPKAIASSEAVRTNLLAIADEGVRRKLMTEWTQALLHVDTHGQDPARQVNALMAVGRVLDDAVFWYMQDSGSSYAECWRVRFEQLRHLDEAIERINPVRLQRAKTLREEMGKWQAFRSLVEYRERLIEKHECNDLYRKCAQVPDDQYNVVLDQLEKYIGRPVRPEKEIRNLGKYVRLAGEKVRAQETEALREYHLSKED